MSRAGLQGAVRSGRRTPFPPPTLFFFLKKSCGDQFWTRDVVVTISFPPKALRYKNHPMKKRLIVIIPLDLFCATMSETPLIPHHFAQPRGYINYSSSRSLLIHGSIITHIYVRLDEQLIDLPPSYPTVHEPRCLPSAA